MPDELGRDPKTIAADPRHKHTCRVGHGIGRSHTICDRAGVHICECGARRTLTGEWTAAASDDGSAAPAEGTGLALPGESLADPNDTPLEQAK